MPPTSASITVVSSPADRLATLPKGKPQLTLGYEAAKWTRENLIQPNGPRAGKPFKPTLDQFRFLLWWYALDEAGQWLFNHGVRRLAKGSGKSPMAAVLALIEFCAPVRLARFDDRRDGEDGRLGGRCIGKPVDMPLVQIAATAESQTANTMRMVRAFAPEGSKVVEKYGLDPGKTKYYKLPEGTLEVITSSATAAEGSEASFIVADETEHWKPSNGGVELAATLADNLAKSGNRMLETSNAYVPGADTVAEGTWDAWLAQEEGRTRGQMRILYDARLAPPDTDMSDPDSLRKALEWIYGDCDWKKPADDAPPNVKPIMERIWSPRARPDDSKRKYLNWPTAAYDAWVTLEEWKKLADPTVVVDPEEPVVLFFDGSKSKDATALVGCTIDAGHVFTLGTWEPDPNDPDSTVDFADVDRVVMETFNDYRVVAFFADVREWEQFTLTTWPERYKAEVKVWAAPQARPPQSIAWDMRGHSYEFAKATEACYAEIVEQGFTHDGNSATTRHIANARRLAYLDNRSSELGLEWDLDQLVRDLDAGFDLTGCGFEEAELAALLRSLEPVGGLTDPDDVPEPPEEPISKLGDLWVLGTHRLLCGDSTQAADVTRLMAGERASLMPTDPPYLVGYDGGNHPQSYDTQGARRAEGESTKHWDDYTDHESAVGFYRDYLACALAHALGERPLIYQWFGMMRMDVVLEAWRANGLLPHQVIIWHKSRPVLARCDFMWDYEPCMYGWIKGQRPEPEVRPPANARAVWDVDQREGIEEGAERNHSTMKPVEVIRRPIEWHTSLGELIYEPFSGSGTALIAAEMTGRRCYAMELSPVFVDVAVTRWQNFTGKVAERVEA